MKPCLRLWLAIVAFLGAGIAASAQPAAAPAEDSPPPPTPASECARWKVFYQDSRLGIVVGDATVDWDSYLAVVKFQYGGLNYRLESQIVPGPGKDDPHCQFRFKGASPDGSTTAAPDTTGAQPLVRGSEAVVKVGREEDHFAFGVPATADDNTVTVDLAKDDEGDMEGRWSYAADPLTQRDAHGGGRTAHFSMATDGSFAGQQSGSELWLQQRPEIDFVVVLDDQLEIPWYAQPANVEKDARVDRRTLFIVGRHLPVRDMVNGYRSFNAGRLESLSPDATYTYQGQTGDKLNSEEDAKNIQRGWAEVCRPYQDEAARRAILSREGALIKVKLQPGFVPGPREFTWAGVRIPWRLETRDARAEMNFVRPAGGPTEWEKVSEAYLPEDVSIELRVAAPIPYDVFTVTWRPFFANLDGDAKALGPEFEVTAQRVGPQLFRTDPLPLTARGFGFQLPSGAVLIAHAKPGNGLLSCPATAQVKVTSSPGRNSPLWTEYLWRAAKSQGVETSDPRSLEIRAETRISKTLIFLLQRQHTDIYYGDHAAMLMLRDHFLDLMRRSDMSLGGAVGPDDGALGYAKIVRAQLRADERAAVGTLPAGLLNGNAVTLAQAVDPGVLRGAFGDHIAARDQWLIGAVRTAVAERRRTLRESIATAEAIKDDEIEKLLRLTGSNFEPIVADCLPRLMMLDPDARWVRDRIARGYLRGLGDKFKELRAAQAAADIDTQLAVGVAGALVGLPTVFSQSAMAYAVVAAGNGVLFAATSGADLYATYQAKQEVAFAFGASPVLGDTRFQDAVLEDPGWVRTLGMIGVNAAFTGWQVRGDIHKAQAALQIGRGARIAEDTLLSLQGLSTLAEHEQRDLLAFLAHARSLDAQGRTLTGIQRGAVDAFDQLGALAAKDPAAVAQGVAMTGKVRAAEAAIVAEIEKSVAANATKEALESLRIRRESLTELWHAAEKDPRVLNKLTDFDLGWLSGKILQPDEQRAMALAAAHDLNWHDLKNAFMDGKVSAAEMHNFVTHREQFVIKMLDESIEEVAKAVELETKVRPNLFKKALGSTNLTSDLDYSVFGPGAERVVKVFNDKFRALAQFKGLESGHVFDTNVYTQAVYELFSRDALVGKSLGIANADLDSLRQFMYEQMATRKYIGGAAEWEKHTAALLGAAPDAATRKLLSATFEEADYAYRSARQAIAKKMGVAGEEALHAAEGTNELLRATNGAYEEVLSDIDQWRTEMTRLQQLQNGRLGQLPAAAPEFLERYPGWRNGWAELTKLATPGKRAELDALAKTWADRLAYQLRKKQGGALFFASEAYQDEATILHVVKDLQENKRGKLITFAKLNSGEGGRASKVLSQTDGRGALNSMMENLANLRKELGHADDATKAAAKGGKYFIRVLDAGHEAGLDVVKIVGKDLVEQTIGVDSLRATVSKVGAFLKESGTSDAAYVKALQEAHERLGVEMVKHKDITNFAARVHSVFDELPGAAEATSKSAAIGETLR